MNTKLRLEHEGIFKTIKLISNRIRFKILELSETEKNVTELGKELKLSYKRTSDYCARLEKLNLVSKRKEGKEVFIKNNVDFSNLSNITAK